MASLFTRLQRSAEIEHLGLALGAAREEAAKGVITFRALIQPSFSAGFRVTSEESRSVRFS